MEYNIYCDESCHLQHDGISKMILGCVWLPRSSVRSVSDELIRIRNGHGFRCEMKWTKISPSKLQMYQDVLQYFWRSDLSFRCLVVRDKSLLDHDTFNLGSHDSFYYKMFFQVLRSIIEPANHYHIYLDRKDSRSTQRTLFLREVLCSSLRDPQQHVVPRIQNIRSYESVLLQVCDILIGAVGYFNRGLKDSEAKTAVCDSLVRASGQRLDGTTPLGARKFNIFIFDPQVPRA
jgi:hypothetical protein